MSSISRHLVKARNIIKEQLQRLAQPVPHHAPHWLVASEVLSQKGSCWIRPCFSARSDPMGTQRAAKVHLAHPPGYLAAVISRVRLDREITHEEAYNAGLHHIEQTLNLRQNADLFLAGFRNQPEAARLEHFQLQRQGLGATT